MNSLQWFEAGCAVGALLILLCIGLFWLAGKREKKSKGSSGAGKELPATKQVHEYSYRIEEVIPKGDFYDLIVAFYDKRKWLFRDRVVVQRLNKKHEAILMRWRSYIEKTKQAAEEKLLAAPNVAFSLNSYYPGLEKLQIITDPDKLGIEDPVLNTHPETVDGLPWEMDLPENVVVIASPGPSESAVSIIEFDKS